MHRNSFLVCPLHALASQIALSAATSSLFDAAIAKDPARTLNAELVRLTSIARSIGHEIQPNLTSHSFRAGPATLAYKFLSIKPEWIADRGAWTSGDSSAGSIHRYREPSAEGDAALGRVLSDWPSVKSGGLCPMKSMLPIASEDCAGWHRFSLFTTYLLGSASLNNEVKEVLSCVLIKSYREMKAQFPNHCLVRQMLSTGFVNDTMLLEWSDRLTEVFNRENITCISHSKRLRIEADGSQQCSSTTERLDSLESSVQTTLGLLQSLHAKVEANQKSVEHTLKDGFRLLSQQNMQQQVVGAEADQHSSSSSSQRGTRIPAMFVSSLQRSSRLQRENSSSSLELPEKYAGPSLANIRCKTLFKEWFRFSLFNCETKNIERMNKLARCVAYMKALLPAGTVIPSKPTPEAAEAVHDEWVKMIARCSDQAEEALIKALKIHHSSEQPNNVRDREPETKLQGALKNLNKMLPSMFNPQNTIDNCTSPKYQFKTVDDIRKIRRQKRKASAMEQDDHESDQNEDEE